MVVLASATAALYAALLIPFKPLVLIPGLTEMRPAAAIPLVAGLLFGPAGAVGAALGNLMGDFFGTLGWGSLFGLGGNFLLAYIPYRLIRASEKEYLASWRGLVLVEATVVLAAAACGLFIGWGGDLLGIAPFAALGLDLKELEIISIKSRVHFRAFYNDVAGEIIEIDAPGLGPADVTQHSFENAPEGLYPFVRK